ncbi:MAG: AMP-binding protein [Bacteroidales bacterium]|nr:AMP-binding protein [Bacteroidales bacterium]
MPHPPLLEIYSRSFRDNFQDPCLTEYTTGKTITYGEFSKKIARLHLLFEKTGIKPGDKVALLGKNTTNWVVVFMATITYGAVIVPILNDFNPHDCAHIINHSGSVILFISDSNWESLDFSSVPDVYGAISLDTMKVVADRKNNSITDNLRKLPQRFRRRYPHGFRPDDITYEERDPENIALINYTSGTTGFSKGVMLSLRALWGNVSFGIDSRLHYKGSRALSFLPLAHAYGCAFDMLVPLAVGTHITLLGRTPTPMILMRALAEVKPSLIICVPLILEKIYKKMIVPAISSTSMRWALAIPFLDRAVFPRIRNRLIQAFGGEFEEVIVGGAPLNSEVENFLHKIHFPFTVGYGMTECGPLISYTPWRQFIPGSSGHILDGYMEARILSEREDQPGEILVRGTNEMSGYYRKSDITAATIDEDGWLHTGDMGTLGGDDGKTLFIRGRYKTMILSATGQNIYPEEIESKLNNMPYVMESLVVERNGKLIALVFPDSEATDKDGIDDSQMPQIMENIRHDLNQLIAPYEQVSAIQLVPDEFQKTPKRSIKRFLYQ